MQDTYENILSPNFNDPLHYFDSSPPTSRTTPPIYADDPWSTIPEGTIDFNSTSSSYVINQDMSHNSYFVDESNERNNAIFGSELTSSNVLLGVDIPDIYIDVYSKSNPQNEKIEVKSLEIILEQLSGLSISNRQKVMSLVTSPTTIFVTRNDFNAYLALIACAQKNMDVSLETVYEHRNDIPIPTFKNLDSFNIRDIINNHSNIKNTTIVQPPQPNSNENTWDDDNTNSKNQMKKSISSSSITTTVHQDDEDSTEEEQPNFNTQSQRDQQVMNQWLSNLDHINVSRTSEKEGFIFKHINYEVESEKLGSKVLRRFSDFFWLWEILLKRYPFRILPNLPPKKLGGRDDIFEERRRKGLVRFINAVAWHPILGKDDVVITFLSHPSEVNSWKRANFPSLDEEFVRKSHNIVYLERLIPMDLDDRVNRMKKRLSVSIQQYEHMCHIMNQMNRLKKALGSDYIRFSVTLNSELDKPCWMPGCQGCPQVTKGCNCISKSIHQAGVILNKQAIATGDSIVENLKRQRDLLESFKELLERKERMSPIHNDLLARQVARYKQGQLLPSVAHDDYDAPSSQQQSTTWDEHSGLDISQQRDIFIKHCILEELSFLHKQQANVSIMYNAFVRDEVRYARQWSEHWKQLEVLTSEMPNTPQDFL